MAYSHAGALAVVLALAACGGGSGGGSYGPTIDASRITPGCFQGGATPELQIGTGFQDARLERSPRAQGRVPVLDVSVVENGLRPAAYAGADLPLHFDRRGQLDARSRDACSQGQRG